MRANPTSLTIELLELFSTDFKIIMINRKINWNKQGFVEDYTQRLKEKNLYSLNYKNYILRPGRWYLWT